VRDPNGDDPEIDEIIMQAADALRRRKRRLWNSNSGASSL
jgi:hypothetical protein